MKKKLDTRFPAARIKKIMQADEDIGKIAMAVPVLVSKALELFLQDLCDRTYDITLQRGAKTMNSLHLKHCVEKYTVFDFLGEIVSRVPDYTNPDVAGDDRATPKRRKTSTNQGNDSDEDSRRGKMPLGETSSHPTCGSSSISTGRGRVRGRGRGRGGRFSGRQPARATEPEISAAAAAAAEEKEGNIDLNTEALGKGGVPVGEEYNPWPMSDFNIDRVETEEEEEDYDQE